MSDQLQFRSLVGMVLSLEKDCWEKTAEYLKHSKPVPDRDYELFGDFFGKLSRYEKLEDDAAKPAARKELLDFWSANGGTLQNRWPDLIHAAGGFRQEIDTEDSASENSTTASSKQVPPGTPRDGTTSDEGSVVTPAASSVETRRDWVLSPR